MTSFNDAHIQSLISQCVCPVHLFETFQYSVNTVKHIVFLIPSSNQ